MYGDETHWVELDTQSWGTWKLQKSSGNKTHQWHSILIFLGQWWYPHISCLTLYNWIVVHLLKLPTRGQPDHCSWDLFLPSWIPAKPTPDFPKAEIHFLRRVKMSRFLPPRQHMVDAAAYLTFGIFNFWTTPTVHCKKGIPEIREDFQVRLLR